MYPYTGMYPYTPYVNSNPNPHSRPIRTPYTLPVQNPHMIPIRNPDLIPIRNPHMNANTNGNMNSDLRPNSNTVRPSQSPTIPLNRVAQLRLPKHQASPLREVSLPSDFQPASAIYPQNPQACCYVQTVDSLLDIPPEYRNLDPGQPLDLFDGLDPCAIHPLFRREAVFGEVIPDVTSSSPIDSWGKPLDDLTYNNALPAFALCSAWLQTGMGFFWTILKGKITEKDEKPWLTPRQDLLSAKEQKIFEAEMNNLAQLTTICAVECDGKPNPTYGRTNPCAAGWKSDDDENDVVFRISCLAPLWDELSKPDFQTRPLVEKCTVWVMLASILMHEIAHLVWMYRHHQDIFDDYYVEHKFLCTNEPMLPYYPKSDELGIAWEAYQLGGTLWSRKTAIITEEGRQPWYEVHDCKKIPEIVSYREEYNAKLIQRISPISLIRLMRKSTWTSGKPVPIYAQCLQRITVPSFSEMEHDSKHSNADTSDSYSVATCESHDDCEDESDPEWDPANPNKFWDAYDATGDNDFRNAHSSSSSETKSCDSLYNDTKSERRYMRRQRRERLAAKEQASENSDTDMNEGSDSDNEDDSDSNDGDKRDTSNGNASDPKTVDKININIVDESTTKMVGFREQISTFTYPEANEANNIVKFYDPVLTLPEENELLGLTNSQLSEDLVAFGMNNLTTNSQTIDEAMCEEERWTGTSVHSTSSLFTEDSLKRFNAQFAAMPKDVVDKWLQGVSSAADFPPSEDFYNDIVMDWTGNS